MKKPHNIGTFCLHCEVSLLLCDDISDNGNSAPAYQGACMGRAIGEIIGLTDDELKAAGFGHPESYCLSPDERYKAAIQCLTLFGEEICKASKLLDVTPEHLLSDAARMAKRLDPKTKRR